MEKREGGGQEVGGPSTGALRKRATTFVVACFLPFILPSPTANACYTQTATSTTSLASKREPEVVFFCSFNMSPTTSLASNHELDVVFFVLSTRHPPPPPPSRPDASWRWFFSMFRHVFRHHHLPRIQTQAGGGSFRHFDTSPTTTTSLVSKRELEVVFLSIRPPVPPPPPPSHPNASQRWSISPFRRASLHHHLPRVQTQAGGGFFRCFDTSSATTTSLASKCEPEVVFFNLLTCLPPPPPPSHPKASRRWFFSTFRHVSHHHHLPCIQTRAGGGFFDSFATSPTTTSSLTSKRKPEVVF